jgi:hypothetical protein
MSIAEKLTTIADNQQRVYDAGYTAGQQAGGGYDEGYEAGKKAEYNEFWDAFQTRGSTDYLYGFAGAGWTDKTYNPKSDIKLRYNAQMMYSYARITSTKITIDASAITANCAYIFANCSTLVTIPKLIVSATTPVSTNWFEGCTALVNITIEGVVAKSVSFKDSPLSRASVENIIAVLSDTETGRTATFKRTAVEAAFTTDEWNALVATKSNWTIALS